MKKLCAIAVMVVLAGALWAQASDNFHITVTVSVLGVSLYQDDGSTPYGTWDLGMMASGATAEMTYDDPDNDGDNHIEAVNTGNTAENLVVYSEEPSPPSACGCGTPTAWTPGATAGADTYLLECGEGSESSLPGSYVTCDGTDLGSADQVVSSLASGNTAHLFFKFTTPTSVSDGCQHDITVTVTAVSP